MLSMKSSARRIAFLVIMGVATLLLSWNNAGSDFFCPFLKSNFYASENYFQYMDDESFSPFAEEFASDDFFDSGAQVPPAEDVLVQRIAGDNNHLLMMAYYSREN